MREQHAVQGSYFARVLALRSCGLWRCRLILSARVASAIVMIFNFRHPLSFLSGMRCTCSVWPEKAYR